MKHFSVIALLAMSATLLQACSKKDDNSGGSIGTGNATTQKVVGTWSIESKKLVYTNPDGSQGSVYDHLLDCEKDDLLTFKSDGTYSVVDGINACGNGDYGSNYIWRLPDDSSLDCPHGPALQGISTIEQLDNTTMRLSAPIPPNGRKTFVFRRK